MGLGSYDDPLLDWMRSEEFGRAGRFGRQKAGAGDKLLRRLLSAVKAETTKEKPDQWKVERVAVELEGPPVEVGEEPVAEAMRLYSGFQEKQIATEESGEHPRLSPERGRG